MVRPILLVLIIAAARAGEEQPFLSVSVTDGGRLVERWQASVYAKLWADPSLTRAREQVDKVLEEARSGSGIDPILLLRELRGFGLAVSALPNADGKGLELFAQADLGSQARTVFARLREARKDKVEPAAVDGADEAMMLHEKKGDITLARFASRVLVLAGQRGAAVAPRPAEADLVVSLDYPRFAEAVMRGIPGGQEQAAELKETVAATVGSFEYRLTIVPEGMLEQYRSDVAPDGAIPLDRTHLAALPSGSMLTWARGLDPTAVWRWLLKIAPSLPVIGGDGDAERTKATMEHGRAAIGLGDEALAGLKGTWSLSVTPAAPFPSVSLGFPRHAAVDAWVGHLFGMLKQEPPADGACSALAIPNLPLPLCLACGKKAYLLTSDLALASAWASGRSGGWIDSPTAKCALAVAAPTQVATLDTAAIIASATPWLVLGMSGDHTLDAQTRSEVMNGLVAAQKLLQPTYLTTTRDGKGLSTEVRGPFGSGLGLASIAVVLANVAFVKTELQPDAAEPDASPAP